DPLTRATLQSRTIWASLLRAADPPRVLGPPLGCLRRIRPTVSTRLPNQTCPQSGREKPRPAALYNEISPPWETRSSPSMFDLFRSREKAVRILLGGMLLLVAISMLTYLIPTYDTGSGISDQVVAQVGKEKIMLTDVQKTVQNAVRGRQLPAEIIPNY